ncbi:glutamyl-tRNA(Gln) and/or aspartyl-tRNA(Asn) amidotransferase, C subunit [Halobacteroides halobius DSM 5150]|uniref:Aspartyl/glutamyl-tRNA(Asn/Gln) amidotransferase subunit C n=1 Tax=Halobacteroides halobius (strain ATCC 35273 / DSM 5150 / MD-1) TaxID=748449 RepID=L0KA42_HALHC|nr:Asp-tRNA(Asn)/Glu-tRNA(Gln) amidotransferase subunit GatC [Halobacteroides halobius]AGB42177.1 glutamyl-tRNA(Gln) and/or aspartyl-tRNA(Asn) amidotransferase, C subunit [Halobacteroides halobius DSM 5150]
MKLDKETVERVAHLARLELTEAEKDKFTEQLSDILGHAEKLNQLDTEDVDPMAHVLPVNNVFRDDEVRESLDREEALANAPEKERGMFKVPQIVSDE